MGTSFQCQVVEILELHDIYPGVYMMKTQSYGWWTRIEKDIKICVQYCWECQLNPKMPAVVPLHP